MSEHVIRIAEERLRYWPDALSQLTYNGPMLFARLKHYMETGSHTPSFQWDARGETIWWSMYRESGASAELADIIAKVLELWPGLVDSHCLLLAQLGREKIVTGDRFVVLDSGEDLQELSAIELHGHALDLDDSMQSKLLGAQFALEVSGNWYSNTHERHTRLIEALATYQPQIKAIVNESRLWRADGVINGKKVIKLLSDTVSSTLGKLDESELQTVAMAWRHTNRAVSKPNSTEQGVAFEVEVAKLFQACGFGVEGTATTGDFGVDLIVTNSSLRLAVQVKSLATPVGVGAVQEVSAGAHHYLCTRTLVVASNGYTEAAKTLAQSTGTKLETLHSLRESLNVHLTELLNN